MFPLPYDVMLYFEVHVHVGLWQCSYSCIVDAVKAHMRKDDRVYRVFWPYYFIDYVNRAKSDWIDSSAGSKFKGFQLLVYIDWLKKLADIRK